MGRLKRPPSRVVETLRFLVVVLCAAIGWQIARSISGGSDAPILGWLNGPTLGLVIGAGFGYSAGGIVARYAVSSLDRGDRALEGVTPEELVAGSIGGMAAGLLTALLTWPVFLLTPAVIAACVFAFVVILGSAFGFTVAKHRREAVLGALGARAGISATPRQLTRGRLIDTSVAIDGRILDVIATGFAEGRIVVCQPVLDELQNLADSSDQRRRQKGRKGLETLDVLRRTHGISVTVIPDEAPEIADVDAKLVRIAIARSLALLTLDTGLAKSASIAGAVVQNLHALSLALRPPVLVGDSLTVRLVREGKEAGQAVAYLDDGTMVVVERGRDRIGGDLHVEVTSVLVTSNGRMVFARRLDDE
ncbi:MAG: hypothetical protein U0904_12085 [Candidatus Nanopelagicales bacterium]|nr:hypothetical protein [Candidatus Nanopelagicales bacterium]